MTPSMLEDDEAPTIPCPRCDGKLLPATTRTAIWQGDRVAVVEDVPARVCDGCREQFFDDDVSDALRRLNETGFQESEADRMISVPVFSLEGRIRKRGALPEDTYVD